MHRLLFAAICSAVLLSWLPRPAAAQATRTATKSADISVFGGFQFAQPDYSYQRSSGGMLGADFTRYIHLPVEPSLEFRANFNSSPAIVEHSYLFGLRAAVPLRVIRPYADFLVGPGNVQFPQNSFYTHDNSLVFSYGGGVDVHVVGNFAAKFDYQAQHWNTGELTLTPTVGTIGIVYTLPFRPHVGNY